MKRFLICPAVADNGDLTHGRNALLFSGPMRANVTCRRDRFQARVTIAHIHPDD
ncbi:MAG TPA: hypothetical protein VK395_15215 [Gemmataceae bacterium]|nr:hypothetical protein [Gemmataceae bacterium]